MRGLKSRRGGAFAALAGAALLSAGAVAQDADRGRADRDTAEHADDDRSLIERRAQLEEMAEHAIDELQEKDEAAAELYHEAYGYAVLDTTKGGLLVSGTGGTGVAMQKRGGEPRFMHVGGAGIGAVGGVSNYKLVLLFEDRDTFEEFVDGEWQAGANRGAVAGEKDVSPNEFFNGVAAYRIDENGLIARAEVEGMRFWPSDRLN
ncbi:MAG TPA: hypothetical protein VIN61_01500 [Gammaproteobacteria bacterium]